MSRASSTRWLACLAIGALSVQLPLGSSRAEEDDEKAEAEDVNYVDLAAKMIADGHYDRAEEMLAGVNPEQEGVDRKKLFSLRGIVYLKKQLFSAAAEAFEAAIVAGQSEAIVKLYLAQAYFGLKKYDKCLESLDAAGATVDDNEEVHLMRAQANWELGRQALSIAALDTGLKRFPTSGRLQRMRIFFLVDLGLYQEVVESSGPYLARQDVTEDDYVAIGEALRAGHQLSETQLLLERAQLRFPESEKIVVQLAHGYLDGGKPTAAAMLFEDAARENAKYYLEAAELYKQGHRLERALSLNARIADQKAKLKQRLSLLLVQEQYEQIAAMTSALSRLNLLADGDVRYALAFACFHTGQFDLAEHHAKAVTDSKLFDAAVELRKAIDTCRKSGWECRR
jgi:tetratricopeptide (TPR) repeat protein